MAKKAKKKVWNVWIDGNPKYDYFISRDKINATCGGSSGSGSGFGGWDTSYHNKTESEAKEIAKKAKSLRCVMRVRIYDDQGINKAIFIKGKADKNGQ